MRTVKKYQEEREMVIYVISPRNVIYIQGTLCPSDTELISQCLATKNKYYDVFVSQLKFLLVCILSIFVSILYFRCIAWKFGGINDPMNYCTNSIILAHFSGSARHVIIIKLFLLLLTSQRPSGALYMSTFFIWWTISSCWWQKFEWWTQRLIAWHINVESWGEEWKLKVYSFLCHRKSFSQTWKGQ